MDYKAIYSSICKAFLDDTKIMYGEADAETMGITVDGFVMYFIPKKRFIFDTTVFTTASVSKYVKSMTNEDGYVDGVKTDNLIVKDKRTIATIKNDTLEVWIDNKLLKPFDKSVTFKIKGEKSAVLIYEDGRLAGLIMPVKKS